MPPTELWRVRVRVAHAAGRVCGAGILIDPLHVLTCAHVFAEATGADGRTADVPRGSATVDFPGVPGQSRRAGVTGRSWVHIRGDGSGDLAVLTLDRPAPSEVPVAPLDWCGGVDGRAVDAYGHPRGVDDGVWASVSVIGTGGPRAEWMQIDAVRSTGRRIERGFSGAGAFDRSAGVVVGVVIAEDTVAANRVAWLVPMETVVHYLPDIRELLPDPVPGVPRQRVPEESAAPLERRLNVAQKRQLRDLLWAVPGMADKIQRDQYLDEWAQLTGERRPQRRNAGDAIEDLWTVIHGLLERPGGIRGLVDVLADRYPDHWAVRSLEDFVERVFPDPLLLPEERAEVERRLAGATWQDVGAAFAHAVRPLVSPPQIDSSHGRASVIRQLEELGPASAGRPPLLFHFVDDLAHRLDPITYQALHRWRDTVGDRLSLDRATLHELCLHAEKLNEQLGQVSFVVQLQPDLLDENRFLMSAWLQWDSEHTHEYLRDDTARTLAEVEAELDVLLHQVNTNAPVEIERLTLELIVPKRLLAVPFDQWIYDRGRLARPLGIRYALALRVLERQTDTAAHDEWRIKTRRLAEYGRTADPDAIHGVAEQLEDIDAVRLYAQLADDRVTCAAIPFPPGGDLEAGPFGAVLESGVPVAVWSGGHADPARFCDLVRGDFAAEGLLKLPARVLSFRRAALKTDSGVSNQEGPRARIGVVFDRFDRMPGQFSHPLRLCAPL
jgi:NTP-dependent ternary conflict system VMAP-like protein/trypsin-like peptidase/effector-associated domain 2 (EAD2)-containing protein